MTATELIKSMLDGQSVNQIGASGWQHLIGIDRGSAQNFAKHIIDLTDKSHWDIIKVMPNGVYNQEAHGSDITYFDGNLSDYDLRTKRVFHFNRYMLESPQDMDAFTQIDVSKNSVYQREVNTIRTLSEYYKGTVPVLPTVFMPAHCLPEFCGGLDKARWYMENYPDSVDRMLTALVQTELELVKNFIDAGADGFFFAQRYSNDDLLTEKQFERFCRPYDDLIIASANKKTWFNIIHVHGNRRFFWNQFASYNVEAISWENTPEQIPEEERSTVAKVRQLTDKVLITGTDQLHDFYGTREEVLDRFRRRVKKAARESEDNRLIFAPGCSLPLDIDSETVHLLRLAADEYNLGKL